MIDMGSSRHVNFHNPSRGQRMRTPSTYRANTRGCLGVCEYVIARIGNRHSVD